MVASFGNLVPGINKTIGRTNKIVNKPKIDICPNKDIVIKEMSIKFESSVLLKPIKQKPKLHKMGRLNLYNLNCHFSKEKILEKYCIF